MEATPMATPAMAILRIVEEKDCEPPEARRFDMNRLNCNFTVSGMDFAVKEL